MSTAVPRIQAAALIIGDEILTGKVEDKNIPFLGVYLCVAPHSTVHGFIMLAVVGVVVSLLNSLVLFRAWDHIHASRDHSR